MSVRRTLFLFFVCLLLPLPLLAQSSTGSISGTITDESGGTLPGVTVVATNVATGTSRTAVTNSYQSGQPYTPNVLTFSPAFGIPSAVAGQRIMQLAAKRSF